MDGEAKLTIFLILICTIAMTGSLIYSTHDSELSDEKNAFTGQVHIRGELYAMFGFLSLSIFTIFWGFIYMAGKGMKDNTAKKDIGEKE